MANSAMEKLLAAVNKAKNGSSSFQDPFADKFWKLEGDKAGMGSAVIRFLPGHATDGDADPFVKLYTHAFKNAASKWFIDNCPTTIGEDCPVCAANGVLWNTGTKENQDIVRPRSRKTSYISNVLVVSDSTNPDNNGKVFMFKYGRKIFDKVVGALTPEFEDETPFNPFDPESGANFKLKMRRVEGYANFDKSEFDKPESIGSAKRIAEVISQLHDIGAIVAKDQFKTYAELETKLNKVLGNADRVKSPDVNEDEEFVTKVKESKPAPKAKELPKKVESTSDDDDLAFFKSLAEDDDIPF